MRVSRSPSFKTHSGGLRNQFKAGLSQAAHGGEFALGTFESIMASVKSGEIAEFLGEMGAGAAEVAAEA